MADLTSLLGGNAPATAPGALNGLPPSLLGLFGGNAPIVGGPAPAGAPPVQGLPDYLSMLAGHNLFPSSAAPSGAQGPSVADQVAQLLQGLQGAYAPAQVDMGSLLAPYDQAAASAQAAGKAGITSIANDQTATAGKIGDLMNQYAQILQGAHQQLGADQQQSAGNLNSALAPLMAALQAQGAGGQGNPLAQQASMLQGEQAASNARSQALLGLTGANENSALTNDKAVTAEQAQSALGLLQANLSDAMNKIGLGRAQEQARGAAQQQQFNDSAAAGNAKLLASAQKFLQDNGMQTGRDAVMSQITAAAQPGSGHEWAANAFEAALRGGKLANGTSIKPAQDIPTAMQNLAAVQAAAQGTPLATTDWQGVQNWLGQYFDTSKSLSPQAPQLLASFLSTLG